MIDPAKTIVIANPTSGAWSVAAQWAQIEPMLMAHLGQIEIVQTQGRGDATALAREAALEGYDRVLIAGGDGSVHFAANGVAGSETALGILPVGTGNDIATSAEAHAYIAEAVNAAHPGNGRWVEFPSTFHGFNLLESQEQALSDPWSGPLNEQVLTETVDWMRGVIEAG